MPRSATVSRMHAADRTQSTTSVASGKLSAMLRFIALMLTLVCSPCLASIHQMEVAPRPQDKFKSAKFSIYVPDGVQVIRAIIVHQHGCGRNGFDVPYDLQWQALARKHDAALMGSHFVQDQKCTDWHEPGNGSNDAFLAAIADFAKQSSHPELQQAPWALWGHSGGAHWVMAMAKRHPTRVIAIYARSGGQDWSKEMLGIPVIVQFGAREKDGRFAGMYKKAGEIFELGRKEGALWALAIDPKSEHDTRNSRQIAIPFFDECLQLRLPAEPGKPLAALDASKGTVVDGSWLATESLGRKWKEFVETGAVADTTPPAAPRALVARPVQAGIELTWQADADLEGGIKAFRIYRDGKLIATVPDGADPKRKSFQWGNYGDEPEPATIEMKFLDAKAAAGAKYQVSTVNHFDLESPKCDAVGR